MKIETVAQQQIGSLNVIFARDEEDYLIRVTGQLRDGRDASGSMLDDDFSHELGHEAIDAYRATLLWAHTHMRGN